MDDQLDWLLTTIENPTLEKKAIYLYNWNNVCFVSLQVMKTYHMYHTESISAESKLKDAEKQEEKQFSKSGDLNVNLLRHEDRQPRRSSARKIEKMKEKVSMCKKRRVLCDYPLHWIHACYINFQLSTQDLGLKNPLMSHQFSMFIV